LNETLVVENIVADGELVKVFRSDNDYDSDLCCNGGSYYQPYYCCEIPKRHECLIIDDSSCGDFGTRIRAALYRHGTRVAFAYYGGMLADGQEHSDFDTSFPRQRFWIEFAESSLGYTIPHK